MNQKLIYIHILTINEFIKIKVQGENTSAGVDYIYTSNNI